MGGVNPGSPAHVAVVDNHDSFTYNTVQLLGSLGARCTVVLDDQMSAADLERIGIRSEPGGSPAHVELAGTFVRPRVAVLTQNIV